MAAVNNLEVVWSMILEYLGGIETIIRVKDAKPEDLILEYLGGIETGA